MARKYRALCALIGEATSDGRIFDALTWRAPPLCLMWQVENLPGHEGAQIVGRLDAFEQAGNEVWASITFDDGSEVGREAHRLVDEEFLRGVSVDAAVLDFYYDEVEDLMHFNGEIGALTLVSFPAFRETQIEFYEDDAPAPYAAAAADGGDDTVVGAEVEPPSQAPASDADAEPPVPVAASSATLVFPDGWSAGVQAPEIVDLGNGVGLVASGRRTGPPVEWFRQPALSRRSGLHFAEADERGVARFWGHIYGWGECHTGSPTGQCIRVPRGGSYKYVQSVDGRGVVCSDGTMVSTGPLMIAADHPATSADVTWTHAKDHYANTALAVGDYVCGEDEFGIWVAGATRPGTTDEQLHVLRASDPSGDWRRIGGQLELIATLIVNFAGYPAIAASFSGVDPIALIVRSPNPDAHDCGCGGTDHGTSPELAAAVEAMQATIARWRAAEDAEREQVAAAWERDLGLDPDSLIAAWEADLGRLLPPTPLDLALAYTPD